MLRLVLRFLGVDLDYKVLRSAHKSRISKGGLATSYLSRLRKPA